MDQLYTDGRVDINTRSASFRSAFVGAVLATLPGTATRTRPGRVWLVRGRDQHGTWREPPPEVADAVEAIEELTDHQSPGPRSYRQSPAARKAVEKHAVHIATTYLRDQGWRVRDVGSSASYDLQCKKGGRTLHVEVKGTTSTGDKVLLTRNEVSHARGTDAGLALFVLAGISLSAPADGDPVAEGGTPIVLHPWVLDEGVLDPIGYEYSLP